MKKFYEETWFSIVLLVVFFPIGLFTMWKYTNWKKNIKIIVTVSLIGLIVLSAIFSPKITTYSSEVTYTIPGEPAKPAVTKKVDNIQTKINGEYVIGMAPKEYATGKEKEFTTSQSGNYIAGEDFPEGVYDLVPVSGGGNVQGSGLNEIMGVGGNDFYTNYFDNKEFKAGDSLKVSGVSLKLVPQTNDKFFIPDGTYNLTAIEGGGNVTGSGLNEIMGVEGGSFYVRNYDNAKLTDGAKLRLSGVALELEPKVKEIVVEKAVDATPDVNITENYTITNGKGAIPTCTINDERVGCDELEKLDDLKKDIDKQMKSDEK